jgi:hypothetical protein
VLVRIVTILIICACFAAPAAGVSFGEHPMWDDGLAEVAVYKAKTQIYGKLWDHEMVLATVKEDLTTALYVKADPPYGKKELLPVLKQNIFTRIQTANYPYHYLVSVFVDRKSATRPVKMTVGSQEWCGNTFKELKFWERPASIVYHSYFDGQGDGEAQFEFREGDMLREQLFLALRTIDFREGYTKSFRLLNSQMTNKYIAPAFTNAALSVEGTDKIETLGKEVACWNVTVTAGADEMRYWFTKEFPHVLVKYADSRGQEMHLERIAREAYWDD